MTFSGFLKTDLVNYPGCVAASVFTDGCNMRCPYCHNPSLVLGTATEKHTEEEVLEYIARYRRILDGLVISGGEPTLNQELEGFLRKVKALGLLVKLDTNGTAPEVISCLIDKKLVDYVAMDIKAPIVKYRMFFHERCPSIEDSVRQSISLIAASPIEHEFRTTCPKSILNPQDFNEIAVLLGGLEASVWYLQPFNPAVTLDGRMGKEVSYSREELLKIADSVRNTVPEVRVR